MKVIRYGFFGEDDAQQLFLQYYLTAIAAGQSYRFQSDDAFGLRFKGQNKTRVDNLFDEVCEIGLLQYRQECFFVGRDLDDYDATAFREKKDEMQKRLRNRQVQAFLIIPVQCIEHWLWYLKWRIQHPRSTKNESFETEPREKAKLVVYNAKKCSPKHSNPIVVELAAGMDAEWLASRSASFLAFHQQVKAYLTAQGL